MERETSPPQEPALPEEEVAVREALERFCVGLVRLFRGTSPWLVWIAARDLDVALGRLPKELQGERCVRDLPSMLKACSERETAEELSLEKEAALEAEARAACKEIMESVTRALAERRARILARAPLGAGGAEARVGGETEAH